VLRLHSAAVTGKQSVPPRRISSTAASGLPLSTKFSASLNGELLQKEVRPRGSFGRVHVTAGNDPAAAEDNKTLGLVILDARFPHAGRGAVETAAMKAAADVLKRRGRPRRR
jgi:hypothetical protein